MERPGFALFRGERGPAEGFFAAWTVLVGQGFSIAFFYRIYFIKEIK